MVHKLKYEAKVAKSLKKRRGKLTGCNRERDLP